MAIVEVNRNNAKAREFSQKLLGKGGFILYKPNPEDKDFFRRWTALSLTHRNLIF